MHACTQLVDARGSLCIVLLARRLPYAESHARIGSRITDMENYDTVEQLGKEVLEARSCDELAAMAWKAPLSQKIACSIITGELHNAALRKGWGSGCRCDKSVVYVRSYPKGRFGMPLEHNELRCLVTCSVSLTTSTKVVSVIRAFLASGLETGMHVPQKHESSGALHVPFVPVLVFDDHATHVDYSQQWVTGNHGYHMIIPGMLSVCENGVPSRIVCSEHDYAVAGALTGIRMPDKLRRPVEQTTAGDQYNSRTAMLRTLAGFMRAASSEKKSIAAANAVAGARMLCESLSPAGLLDMMASDIASEAVPSGFTRTPELPLFIAVVTRIAAYPQRYGLLAGTGNDVWAATTIAAAFEADHQAAAVLVAENGQRDTIYAIDVVANYVFSNIARKFSSATNDRHVEEFVQKSAMEACLRYGYQLTVDVASPLSYEGLYTPAGFADQLVDVCTIAHDGCAVARGLGKLHGTCMPPRQVSRAERQKKLLCILDEVDEYLRTGRNNGRVVAAPNAECGFQEEPKARGCSQAPVHVPECVGGENKESDDFSLCSDAFKMSQILLERVFLRGSMNTCAYVDAFVAGSESSVKCADCERSMHALQALSCTPTYPHCARCGRRRCWSCGEASTAATTQGCLRCTKKQHKDVK